MKITEMKGSEVLPGKSKECFCDMENGRYCVNCYINKTIDAYNNVDFDGEVDNLTKYIKASRSMYRWEIKDNKIGDDIQDEDEFVAKSIISQMPKWVVIRKGK